MISFWSEVDIDWVWLIPPGIAVLIAGWVLYVRVEVTGAKHVPLPLLRLGWACYGFAWGYLGAVSLQQGAVNDSFFLVGVGFLFVLAGVSLIFAGFFLSREKIIDQSKYLIMSLPEMARAERMKNAIPPSERVRRMHEEDD